MSLVTWFACILPILAQAAAPDGQLKINAVDKATRQPVPVRMELTNAKGRPVRTRGLGVGALGNHFYLPADSVLGLKRGDYLFLLDAGPEFRTQRGDFKIERHADDSKTVEMDRFADLANEGWYAGDFDSLRNAIDMPLMTEVEALHFAPAVGWVYDGSKWEASPRNITLEVEAPDRLLSACGARVEMPGGVLLLFSDKPFAEPPITIEPGWTSSQVIRAAKQAQLHVVAASATAWELPVWLATEQLDAVVMLTRNDLGDYTRGSDATLRPRDTSFYPGKQGHARWEMASYFQLLNCGLQLTPVAGSGSGVTEVPLGTNRTYVYHANSFSVEAWWAGVEQGATVVTNGPLIRPQVGGDPPGTEFYVERGGQVDFQIALNLASRDTHVDYLELIKNGEVIEEVRLGDWAAKGGRLPPVVMDASGWFAVRAVTNKTTKYQYALTAPYYATSPEGPRISRESVEFFQTWLEELSQLPAEQRSATPEEMAAAREYWQGLLLKANAP